MNNFKINNHDWKIIQMVLAELKWSNCQISLYYSGFHNNTYLVEYKKNKYQLRIPINDFVLHNVEEKVIGHFDDYIYYKNGVLLKKWFDGEIVGNKKLNHKQQLKLLKEIKSFHNLNILNLPVFDWNTYGFISEEFNRIANKYKNPIYFKTTHGDLNSKNILMNHKSEFKLIDFEWCRLNHIGFDIVCLIENLNISRKLVKKIFDLNDEIIDDFIYLKRKFDFKAYQSHYAKIKIDKTALKPVKLGLTNNNFQFNNLFLKIKNYDGFNHQNSLYFLNNLYFCIPVLYDDKEKIIQKFYIFDQWKSNFKNLKIIVSYIKELQNLNPLIEISKNQTYQKCLKWYKEKETSNYINLHFTEKEIKQLFFNLEKLPSSVLSHNDLNINNIVSLDKNLKIIDWEYLSFNHKYFDLAYLTSSLNLNKKNELKLLKFFDSNFDLNEYFRIKCLVNFYALLWSLNLKDDFDLSINLNNIKKYLAYLN
ncbi:phosphotransferase [Mycoplasmopsis gallinarum]|uniref:phosphotransferase n=1 Tax=Mycoplasmopsis gallinarum TaxID=29557 RepID=UPI0004847219|nr:phosphotransferase [Mycoplasmopsis gallinarum]